MKKFLTGFKAESIIPIIVSMAIFMEFLDITILNTAVPNIAKNFSIDPVLLKFSVASYFLSLAIFIPISGFCADKFGAKKIFILSVSLFAIASLLCGVAQNVYELTVFRFLQGVGGSFMNPVARIIILRLFSGKDLIRVQGVIFIPATLGYVLGPFFGGLLINYLSWRWIFFINLPIAALALYFGIRYIKEYVNQCQSFDWFGFILAAVALCGITFFVEMLNHYELVNKSIVYGSGLIGALVFFILIVYCLKVKRPVLDFSLLKIKTFRIGFNINLNTYALNASISFLIPLMYQESFRFSPLKSGIYTLPIAFGYFVFRVFAARIINQFGFRKVIICALISEFIWLMLIAQFQYDTSLLNIVIVEFMFGSSSVICGASVGALIYLDVDRSLVSRATSIDLTFRQFAASIGIGISAFFLTILRNYLHLELFYQNAQIFHYTFYTIGIFVLLALLNANKLCNSDGAHALQK